jgi:UDP-N-acetylmuramyl pentapeptide phosphotransferase/UDP-N-acetylglucosamine-1-phosphate transferase
MEYLPGIFSLVVAAAGWFYMFYSTAASRLASAEPSPANVLRVRMRRIGGLAMILLAIAFYVMFAALAREDPVLAGTCLLVVCLLMSAIIVLGLVDLRLTHRIRSSQQRQDHP